MVYIASISRIKGNIYLVLLKYGSSVVVLLLGVVFILVILLLTLKFQQFASSKVDEAVEKKELNKQKIVELFEGDRELTNEEIRKALGVSERSAVRYMDELGA